MEKTTKKRKKSKSLRRRIGIVAIGGLSLVLTVCLSVGATLAWFAGSTWADKSLYMGGPVYVEMAGRGNAGGTAGSGTDAKWMGGAGSLDIAAVARSSGTVGESIRSEDVGLNSILLPGQRLQVYSQARVFSTAGTTSLNAGERAHDSTGSNTTNTSNPVTGTHAYRSSDGRVTTATTSVLRARFSISVEFDPSVGFNNFTDYNYMANYPTKSTDYFGDVGKVKLEGDGGDNTNDDVWTGTAYEDAMKAQGGSDPTGLTWESALAKVDQDNAITDYTGTYGVPYTVYTETTSVNIAYTVGKVFKVVYPSTYTELTATALNDDNTEFYKYVDASSSYVKLTADAQAATGDSTISTVRNGIIAALGNNTSGNEQYAIEESTKDYDTIRQTHGRRDAVVDKTFTSEVDNTNGAMKALFEGTLKSIYKWKYVSYAEYMAASESARMPAPFDGTVSGYDNSGTPLASNTAGGSGNGFYGLWVLSGLDMTESEAFYKARCNAYLSSYIEDYVDEYGRDVKRTVGTQLQVLENSLNEQFEQLINDSSDNILAGYVNGFTVDANNQVDQTLPANPQNATWMYVDPTIGRDTNTSEISTSKGGWWYLVESVGDTYDYYESAADYVSYMSDTSANAAKKKTYTKADSKTTITTTVGENSTNAETADTHTVNSGSNTIPTVIDTVGTVSAASTLHDATNTAIPSTPFRRPVKLAANQTITNTNNLEYLQSNDTDILKAKLFEVKPDTDLYGEWVGDNNGVRVAKVVSVSFPFVNGSFALPSKALTNIFANAKITFQISFQALQAFFPYTESIDGIDYHWDLLGKEKALNIENAIPIYNEAFDI